MVSTKFLTQALFAGAALARGLTARGLTARGLTARGLTARGPPVLQYACSSDDDCKKVCANMHTFVPGRKATESEVVADKARKLFENAYCSNNMCQCALDSDDRAIQFCKYVLANDPALKKDKFKSAGVNADTGEFSCNFE